MKQPQDNIEETKEKGKDSFHEAKEKGKDSFHEAKEKGKDSFHEAKEKGKDSFHEAKEKGKDSFHEAKEKGKDSFHEAKEHVKDSFHEAKEHVKDSFHEAKEHIKTKFKDISNTKNIKELFEVPNEVVGINKIYLYISTFFGCGYFKYAPGTFASIVAAIIGFIFSFFSPMWLILLITILLVLGFISSEKTITEDNPDPSYVVIDEVVGQLIPFLIIGSQGFGVNLVIAILAVVIFRLLDIYKPWIIGKAETTFKGGIGVMMDDILAGVFTLFILVIVLLLI